MSNARRFLDDLSRQLGEQEDARREIPEPSPPGDHRRLCVAMATYDDFDGVYFTVQSIRLHHPEVLDETSFLIIDNHPEGAGADDLKGLDTRIPHLRYVPFRGYRSTAVRDLVFRIADADIVLCVDSHVLFRPGALRALIHHFETQPASRDLVQGPLLGDDLTSVIGSHFAPKWGAGMYGSWDNDDRAKDPEGDAFEIDMQGLGVFACRRDAWPGFNSRFRGFGGEEGYIHEKVRQQGGRVLCLPALGWAHRFSRPHGPPYRPTWEDRVRNYRIGWQEIGWDLAPMETHFRAHLEDTAEGILSQTERQVANPFMFFDAIFCLNVDTQVDRWETMQRRFRMLDIAWRVERFSAIATPGNHHRGCALSWRAMIAEAKQRGHENVLIFEDDAVFIDTTLEIVAQAVVDLHNRPWDLLYLGGCVHARQFPFTDGSAVLQVPTGVTCAHAVAVNHTAYDRLLDELPAGDGVVDDAWFARFQAVDQYLPRRVADGRFEALITWPRVATQPALANYADSDLEWRDRYVI
jgi:hypothetical protein